MTDAGSGHLGGPAVAASAFYPVVSGPPACNPQSGCSDAPPRLPRFGASPNLNRPGTPSGQVGGGGGGVPQQSLPNALPGGPWVHVCGGLCRVCSSLRVAACWTCKPSVCPSQDTITRCVGPWVP